MVNVAVLGYGTVGSGVVEVLEGNNELIAGRIGEDIHVKYILDLRDFPGDPFEDKIVHDVNVIMEDPEVSVVCEVMGGVGAAFEFTKRALGAGKSVCTSNKELVAKHGAELLALAKANGCNYLFEASVGGGIPVIRPFVRSLTAEKIVRIAGILNGTTNYILTKMDREGADLEPVLKKAQEKGYAERNPEADVEGHDACRKIAILSSLMTGHRVDSESISTKGITQITSEDFAFARAAGYTIRLLGVTKLLEDERLSVMVAPFFVPVDHPLASVIDVFNAIMITGNMVGDTMYYGRGAGKLPTASAVVSDVVDAVMSEGKSVPGGWDEETVEVVPVEETKSRFFVRVSADSVDAFRQVFEDVEEVDASVEGQVGFVTGKILTKDLEEKTAALGNSVLGVIRVF